MSVITSTGTEFAVVAAVPATASEAAYEALAWDVVGEVTDLPEYGVDVTVVNHEPLATGITEKLKGFKNYGSLTVGLGRDVLDAGQSVLQEGADGATEFTEHSFRTTFSDGSVHYYMGKIFSYTTNPGSANSVVASSVKIEINSKVLEVAA